MKKYIAAAAVALALAVGVGVYLGSGNTAAPASTFVLLDGSQKTTADLKGKVTLVNFWATSCVTCVGRDAQGHRDLRQVQVARATTRWRWP
jgi:thiol-disulfide isomerase/thioredoxin